MLIIRPIQEKQKHIELCDKCGCEFREDALAYIAFDADESTHEPRFDIGICQFTIHNDEGVITALKAACGVNDDEALMIMARAVMHFVYRCGFKYIYISDAAAGSSLINSLGFKSGNNGRHFIELEKFYESPCHYN